jgi:3-mercaptopyruvate sulfurtransferase SseA
MRAKGVRDVTTLLGGYGGWVAAGFPIERGAPSN